MKHILIVDDSAENLTMYKSLLETSYEVTPVDSGKHALKFLKERDTDLILLDVSMPQMDGFETIAAIRKDEKNASIPVVFITGNADPTLEAKCLDAGADDFVEKPFDPEVLKRRISRILELYDFRHNLEYSLAQKSRQLTKMALSTIVTIANTVDARDKYTGGHSLRVAVCAKNIAENLGWSESECQNIYSVALLHDIGKIAVPDSILNKPGKLEDTEFEEIKKHPGAGYEILRDITVLPHLREGALFHHERWEGNGYPTGIAEENIPMYARIIAVADAYDAMNSDRIYRKHLSREKIISEFNRGKGTQFDPELVDVFVFMLKSGYSIDESILQTKEASEKVTNDGGLDMGISYMSYKDVDESLDRDSLTGLFTRSYLNTIIGNKISSNRAGAFMMIDIDNFSKIGDNFGSEAAECVILDFAKILEGFFRDDDVLCRLSGNQFAAFVSGESGKGIIEKKARLIIDAVAGDTVFDKFRDCIGVSIGIAECPESGVTFEELYGAADKALSYVKENGKNSYKFS